MTGSTPQQRDVWLARLEPIVGHEQAGTRPVVVVSVDEINRSYFELAIVVPMTSTDREVALHLRIDPPEGGLEKVSFALPEMIRSVSHERLVERLGRVRPETLGQLARRLRIITHPV